MRTPAIARLTLLAFCAGPLTAAAAPRAGEAAAAQAVEARSRAWIQAAIHFDEKLFRSFPTAEFAVMWVEPAAGGRPAHWASKSSDEWVAALRTGRHRYYAVELRDTEVIVSGEVATFRYAYTEKGFRDGADYAEDGMLVETWVRRRGQWLAVSFVAL